MGGSRKAQAGDQPQTDGSAEFGAVHVGGVNPRIARLHHRAFPCHDPTQAVRDMRTAVRTLPGSVRLLVAGGAFGSASLPSPTAVRYPRSEEFEACLASARTWLQAFEVRAEPDFGVEAMFGLDAYAGTERGGAALPIAQLIVHVDADGHGRIVASKRFPVPGDEERYVYLDGADRGLPVVVATALGRTLGLGCHEGVVYSPRGAATEGRGGWRSGRRAAVQHDLRGVEAAINCIHALPSERTFAKSYELATAAVPGLHIVGAFGTKEGVSRAQVLAMAARLTQPSLPTVELIPVGW